MRALATILPTFCADRVFSSPLKSYTNHATLPISLMTRLEAVCSLDHILLCTTLFVRATLCHGTLTFPAQRTQMLCYLASARLRVNRWSLGRADATRLPTRLHAYSGRSPVYFQANRSRMPGRKHYLEVFEASITSLITCQTRITSH
jgi:hypothetical protein